MRPGNDPTPVVIDITLAQDLRTDQRALEAFVTLIASLPPALAVQHVHDHGTVLDAVDAAARVITGRNEDPTNTVIFSGSEDRITLDVWLFKERFGARTSILLKAALSEVMASDAAAGLWAQTTDLMRRAAETLDPIIAYCHELRDTNLATELFAPSALGVRRLQEISWITILGREYVDNIGRDRVLSAPATSVAALDNGTVMLVTGNDPIAAIDPAARPQQAAVLAHLRPDLDEGAYLAALLDRSTKLAPITPAFHSDLARMFEMRVGMLQPEKRPSEIALLNAYTPPPVTEWEPADPSASDVSAADREEYAVWSEVLVVDMHEHIPSVFDGGPEALPEIDLRFWRLDVASDYSTDVMEKELVPAIGAFLGQKLVRNLGGRWVARGGLTDAGVLIGDRIWLPFQRARHYVTNSQAAIDYSLTQFYNEARRHAAGV